MIINGVELEFDATDVAFMRKVKQANKQLDKQEKKAALEKDEINIVETVCLAVFDYFDEIFGQGTAKKIFGDRVSLALCLDVMETFKSEQEEQSNQIKERINKVTEKYKPHKQYKKHKQSKQHNR